PFFFFSSRRRHTRCLSDWSSDVCSSDLDWWRLGSYAFLHIGWAHIAMNAWALWILAPQLEATYGSNQTMGLFASTAIAGGGASEIGRASCREREGSSEGGGGVTKTSEAM